MSRVRRRQILIVAGALFIAPRPRAQDGRTYRVGLLFHVSKASAKLLEEAFVGGLRDLGYIAGRNLFVDALYADGNLERLPALVDELIALRPDVLVGFETAARIMKAKTGTLPIVLTNSSDPVGSGLAQSLSRPGENVTGISSRWEELPPKHIEILHEILPRFSRFGMLLDTTFPRWRSIEDNARIAAQAVGANMVPYHLTNRSELESAFAKIEADRVDALGVSGGGVLFNLMHLVIENAQRLRIPISLAPGMPGDVSALFLYGPNVQQAYRDAAKYVDRILRGARPADLPIEQPSRFEMVANVKIARALGLKIPPSVLLRADRVIE
jgi:putative ABC transport system substrate-binding protein